jgi:hypothetical protein
VIEKAFAIKASPTAIWHALTGELELGDKSAYEIERAITNQSIALWVQLQGGIRARLTYKLIPQSEHTEVVATMEPEGVRYAFFKLLTFGRANLNYEIALVEGLSNLKRSVEGDGAAEDAAAE